LCWSFFCRFFVPNEFFKLELQADVLVSSVGASSQAMVNVDVLAMANPNVGDIIVNSGLPLTNHVIHTNCCQWQGGQGEVVSTFAVYNFQAMRNITCQSKINNVE